jgi:hypothetical protein
MDHPCDIKSFVIYFLLLCIMLLQTALILIVSTCTIRQLSG